MRNRNKFEADNHGWGSVFETYSEASGMQYFTASGTSNVLLRSEVISDALGKGKFNPCFHLRVRGKPSTVNINTYVGVSEPPAFSRSFISFTPGFPSNVDANGLLPAYPPMNLLDGVAYPKFKSATTQMPVKVSLPNFIWELREIGDLIPKICGILKSVASGFLSWEFGWKAIISDIKSMYEVSSYVKKRLEHFRSIRGVPTVVHFSASDFYNPITIGATPAPVKASNVPSYWIGPSAPPPVTSYTSAYKCQLNGSIKICSTVDVSSAYAFAEGCASALGFCNAPKVVWNAIPFTWLLGWFTNSGRLFDIFDNDPFPGSIEVLDSCYSIKESMEIEFGGYVNHEPTNNPDKLLYYEPWSTYYVERYTRRLGMPLYFSVFRASELSPEQLAILLAIASQSR